MDFLPKSVATWNADLLSNVWAQALHKELAELGEVLCEQMVEQESSKAELTS